MRNDYQTSLEKLNSQNLNNKRTSIYVNDPKVQIQYLNQVWIKQDPRVRKSYSLVNSDNFDSKNKNYILGKESNERNSLKMQTIEPQRNQYHLDPNNVFNNLTLFEKKEILEYPERYFVGEIKNKINSNFQNINNNGFDDADGSYIIIIGDHIEYRYEIVKILGKGSFGTAVKCLDHKLNSFVVVKILDINPNNNSADSNEKEIMDYIANSTQGCTNIVKFFRSFKFRNHLVI